MKMEISGLVIEAKTMSPLKLKAGEGDPEWKAGEVIEGMILEKLAENAYLLKAGGREVTILSLYELAVNQAVSMEIQSRQDGRYTVKLLNARPDREDGNIKELIDKSGLGDTPANRALIRGILARGIPPGSETLEQAQNMLKILGGSFPENVETALLALKLGLPPQPRLLEVLQAFISGLRETERGGESRLSRLIRQLGALLYGATAENTAGRGDGNDAPAVPGAVQNPSLSLSAKGMELYRQVKDLLEAIILKPEDGREKLAEQLRGLLASQLPSCVKKNGSPAPTPMPENTALSPGEHATPVTLPSKGNPSREIQPDSPQTGSPPAADTGKRPAIPGLKPSAGEKQEQGFHLEGGENPDMPADRQVSPEKGGWAGTGTQETRFRSFSNLLEKFSRLLAELQDKAKDTGFPPAGREILIKGEVLEKQMAGRQIFLSASGENSRQEYLYFNIPFISYGEMETWGQLRILKNSGGKKMIDPKRFGLAILLNTANMGPVAMEINVVNRDVTASVKVAEDWVARVFDEAWPKLQESFKEMGYNLHQCRCKVGAIRAGLQAGDLPLLEEAGGGRLLDITV